jgi:hypothetical protein
MKTPYDLRNRLFEMDVALARVYPGTSESIKDLLVRLADSMEELMKENKQLLELLGDSVNGKV